MGIDVVEVVASQVWKFFFVFKYDIVARDEVKTPRAQLTSIVQL